ncbi:MarR family transcriptional regulator [Niallia taxi]|uniref:MarR family winged helix-turn-helix transcriptional regulator n=1 Tax=Niallia taxi TaxID=2499688 RepID=UPI00203AC69C|nr:MarR family transcriptional regulator [Niallia taxi]MCM3217098.1 MarR family transcriptional regulator [Niallia taxi]
MLHAIRQFQKLSHTGHTMHGLKRSEIMMLMAIKKGNQGKEKHITVTDLSTALKITSPSVTQVINVLENSGYVERVNDQQDRRIMRIVLTDKGNDITTQIFQKMEEKYSNLVDFLGEEKSNSLIELLDEVYSFFSEEVNRKE